MTPRSAILSRASRVSPVPQFQQRGAATSRKASATIDGRTSSKFEFAKEVVYGESFTTPQSHDAKRLAALKKAVPSLEAHETITRAWALYQRQQREALEKNLKVRYDAMRDAISELEQTDKRLFDAATAPQPSLAHRHKGAAGVAASREGRIDGLFPRQIRAPTEAKGETVKWDSEWRRPGGSGATEAS